MSFGAVACESSRILFGHYAPSLNPATHTGAPAGSGADNAGQQKQTKEKFPSLI